MNLAVETEEEDDGRWLAEISQVRGALAYGADREEAISQVKALALRVLADRIQHGEMSIEQKEDLTFSPKVPDLDLGQLRHRIAVLQESDMFEDYEGLTKEHALALVSTLVNTAKERLAENPTDLQLHYDLGEILVNLGRFTEAIPELQRAQQNPIIRQKAMTLLGQCFLEKNMLDLAVARFDAALHELTPWDPLRKDVLYRFALVYQKLNRQDEYLACLTQSYQAGYGDSGTASEWETANAKLVLAALLRIGWSMKRECRGSHRVLSRAACGEYAFAFHEGVKIDPKMLARMAKHTGLKPEDL